MQDAVVKKVEKDDLAKLLELYTHLNDNPYPVIDARIENVWVKILKNTDHHILAVYVGENLVSTCAITIIENLTHQQTPYAVIENVVTHPDYRAKGYGSRVLSAAKDIAIKNSCHKIILVTGSKKESTLNFYRRAGYNDKEKTAFIHRLNFTL